MQLSVPIVSPIRAHGAAFRAFYLAFHEDEGLTRSALVRKLGREAEPHIEAFEVVGAFGSHLESIGLHGVEGTRAAVVPGQDPEVLLQPGERALVQDPGAMF